MLVSSRWTRPNRQILRLTTGFRMGRTLLTGLTLVAICQVASAASFDEPVEGNGTTSVLLQEPFANESPSIDLPSETDTPADVLVDPETTGAGEPTAVITGGVVDGVDDWWQARHRGVLADNDPPGIVQQLATYRRMNDQNGACWTGRAEAVLLWRNAPSSRPLVTSFNPITTEIGSVVSNANQLQSDVLVAPRITLSRLDSCGRGIDLSYLYAGNFYASRNLPFIENGYALAEPGIYGNTWGVNNTPISAAQQQLIGNLQSAEVNLREPIGWGSNRFLLGFRWLQWWESWTMADQFSDPTDPTVTGADSYATQCTNNLYGGQIGLDTVLWNKGSGFRIESLVKAGAYYNAPSQASSYDYVTNLGFSFNRQIAVTRPAGAAFVGEVGLTAVVPLRRNFDLRCGYSGLWLTGLAQPTNQLSGQTLTQIDAPAGTLTTKGTVLFQGLSLGLEGRW